MKRTKKYLISLAKQKMKFIFILCYHFKINNRNKVLKILGTFNFFGNQALMIWGFVLQFQPHSSDSYLTIQIFLASYLLIAIFLYFDLYFIAAIIIICLPFILIFICYSMIKQKQKKDKDQIVIENIKKNSIKYQPGVIDGDPECRICMQAYSLGDQVIVLPCNSLHHFDKNCISTWLAVNPSCPLCRKDFAKADANLDQPLNQSYNLGLNQE